LDRIDFDIIELLQNDGGLSNKVLAHKIGLAPSSCLERVRRLRDLGVLRGLHAEIDLSWMGVGLEAMIFVRFARQAKDSTDMFLADALTHPEVLSVYVLTGVNDILIHVAVRDVDHLRTLLLDDFLTHDAIAHVETSIIFEHRRSSLIPNFVIDADDS